MSENKSYNFREDRDGEYFLYVIGVLMLLLPIGYKAYDYGYEYWYGEGEVQEVSKVVQGGVLNDSGEYTNVFGDVIGKFFTWKLPNGKTIKIPKGGFEESFLNSLSDEASFGTPYIFDRLYFSSGSAGIDDNSKDQINSLVEILRAYPEVKVMLRGHTDNTGNAALNETLSFQRANNLKANILNYSISDERISVQGIGSIEPIRENTTAEGRTRNRRVDISVIR